MFKITKDEQPEIGDCCFVCKWDANQKTWVYGAAQWIELFGIKQWSQGGWTHWKSVMPLPDAPGNAQQGVQADKQ